MRMLKVLLLASLFGTGAAFAGQDSTVEGSVDTSPPELLNEQSAMDESSPYEELMTEEEALAQGEGEVIYVYPVEVTEYYFVVPSESSEMPG